MRRAGVCSWCEFQEGGRCSVPAEEPCDFKNLAFEKDAIIERLKSETDAIEVLTAVLKKKGGNGEELGIVIDKAKGMSIMVKVLVDKFGMTEAEVRAAVGIKKMSAVDKARLVLKLTHLKRKRAGG